MQTFQMVGDVFGLHHAPRACFAACLRPIDRPKEADAPRTQHLAQQNYERRLPRPADRKIADADDRHSDSPNHAAAGQFDPEHLPSVGARDVQRLAVRGCSQGARSQIVPRLSGGFRPDDVQPGQKWLKRVVAEIEPARSLASVCNANILR